MLLQPLGVARSQVADGVVTLNVWSSEAGETVMGDGILVQKQQSLRIAARALFCMVRPDERFSSPKLNLVRFWRSLENMAHISE